MTIKPFLVDGNLVVNEATITNSGTSIVLPSNSHFSGGGNIFNIATNTTDDITQGTTNLYFTNTKADTRADLRISAASITALSDADQTVQTTDNVTFNNITSTGYIAGPASFTIDPAAVGDNTGTVVIAGNLTVNGTTTTVNSNTVNIGDNILVLNSDETGTPSQNAGIEIERGTSTNVSLRFNETTDTWQFTNDGTTYNDLGTSDIVNDTTPQLGGDLASNGNNINIADGDLVQIGTGNDLQIYHESNVSILKAGTTNSIRIQGPANGYMANFQPAGAVSLYYSSSKKFETTSGGITVTGTLNSHTIPGGTGTIALTSDIPSLSGYLQNVVEDTTPQLGGNLDGQTYNITTTGKVLFANVYSQLGDLPSASTYHGMFAHVHATGKGYFAHASAWVPLVDENTVDSAIDTHLNQTNPTSGYVLSWNGSDYVWVAQSGGGAVGGGTDKTFLETDNSVNSNYTLSTNRNAMTTGPVTINSGATITVPSGQRWIIL